MRQAYRSEDESESAPPAFRRERTSSQMAAPRPPTKTTMPRIVNGQTSPDGDETAGASVAVVVGDGAISSRGAPVGAADSEAFGSAVGVETVLLVTEKKYSPDVGCPSLETTFQIT